MCPHPAIQQGAGERMPWYYCIRVRIRLLYVSSYYWMCPHATVCVYAYDYWMCPHTTMYVCPHTFMCPQGVHMFPHSMRTPSRTYTVVWGYYRCLPTMPPNMRLQTCPHTTTCVLKSVLILLYMCPHRCSRRAWSLLPLHLAVFVSSYYYICVLILLYMCPHRCSRRSSACCRCT